MSNVKKFSLINGSPEEMLLILEPWAEEYQVPTGAVIEVVGEGGIVDGEFEVEYTSNGIIIYGWDGSVVHVKRDGVELQPFSQN
jgi:hypothetical protein